MMKDLMMKDSKYMFTRVRYWLSVHTIQVMRLQLVWKALIF